MSRKRNDNSAGTFLSVDLCPRHGFAMLAVMTVCENGSGGGMRLLGPKSCCAERREVAKWRVTPEDLERIARDLALANQPPDDPGQTATCDPAFQPEIIT